jgi:VCBS repeat protein
VLKSLLLPTAAAIALLSAAPALAAGPTVTAYARDTPVAREFTAAGTPLRTLRAAYPPGPTVGDVTGDGRDDLVTAADGIVTVFDGRATVRRFSPYGDHAIIAIAVADIDGDGHADIVTAPTSGAPFVKVFSGADGTLLRAFLAGGTDKAIIAIAASRAIIAIAIGPDIRVVDAATLATRAFFSPFGGAAIKAVAVA